MYTVTRNEIGIMKHLNMIRVFWSHVIYKLHGIPYYKEKFFFVLIKYTYILTFILKTQLRIEIYVGHLKYGRQNMS